MKRSLSFNTPAVMYHMNGNIQSRLISPQGKYNITTRHIYFPITNKI